MRTRRRAAVAVRLRARWTRASLCAVVLSGVLTPSALQAQDAIPSESDDGAVFVLQGHASRAADPLLWTGPIFRVPVPALSQADLRIDATRFVPNVGTVRGSVDIAANAGGAPARGMVAIGDAAIGAWTVGISAGDTPLSAYSFDYRLSSLFPTSAGLRGVHVSARRGPSEMSVFGGRTTTSAGWFGEKVIVSPQALAGARVIVQSSKQLALATTVTATSATPGPALDVPTSSAAVATDVLYRVWRSLETIAQTTITTARWGDMLPGGARATTSQDRAMSWVAGTRVVSPRRHADFSVVRLGREYLPLPYYTIGDRAGWYASADQQFGERVQLYGSANQWHNNVAERAGVPTISVDQAFAGGRWQLTGSSFLGGRAGAGSVRRVVGAAEIRSTQRSAYADYTRQIGPWRMMGRASEVQAVENDEARATSRREAAVEVRRTWPRGASAWTTVGVLRERSSERPDPGNRFAGNAGLNVPLSQAVAISADAELNRQSVVLATSEVRNAAVSTSLSWALPRNLQLLAHGRYSHDTGTISLYDAAALGPENLAQFQDYLAQRFRTGYEISIRLQKTFKWHNAALDARAAASAAHGGKRIVDFGAVEGVVFNDLDRDGARDPGEAGVSHVTVSLDGERTAESDGSGAFAFTNVPVGLHSVALDERSVPASWDMGERRKMNVDVVKRRAALTSFPLVQLGKLRGRVVVIDQAGGARPVALGPPPSPGPGSNVIVVLNERYKITVTDAEGEYEFTALPAGEYRVSVDPDSLPQLWTPVSPTMQTVVLAPGARVSDVEFAFNVNARAVRRTIVKSQTLPPAAPTDPTAPRRSTRAKRPGAGSPSPPAGPPAGASSGSRSGQPRR